jgi:hypothetical protein
MATIALVVEHIRHNGDRRVGGTPESAAARGA